MIMECLGAIQWDDPAVFGPVAAAVVGGIFLIVTTIMKRKKHSDHGAASVNTTVSPDITVAPKIEIDNKPSNVFQPTVNVGLDAKDVAQVVGQEVSKAVADELRQRGFPHQLELHDETGEACEQSDDDGEPTKPTPPETDPGDYLAGYPNPEDKWVGRKKQMSTLRRAWRERRRRMQVVVGFGGEGKTALVRRFTESLRRAADEKDRPLVVWWSFYFNKSADAFFAAVLTHFRIALIEEGHPLSAEQRARKLVDRLRTGVGGRRLLLVLDGLETLQDDTIGREGRVTDTGLRELLRATLNDAKPDTDARGMILITTRDPLRCLRRERDPRYGDMNLE